MEILLPSYDEPIPGLTGECYGMVTVSLPHVTHDLNSTPIAHCCLMHMHQSLVHVHQMVIGYNGKGRLVTCLVCAITL